jgi:hypothetical protein
MEHVGRHLEKDRNKISLDYKDWNTDRELEKYLLDEGIIEQNRNGEFTLPTLSLRSHNPPRFSSESTIPRYGICSKQTHAFTPLSQVPSLCGSSVPSANTIPEKLPSFLSIQQDHGTQIKAPNHSRNLETIPKPSLKVDEKDDGIASNSLLAWLDDTPDGTPPENVGSHLDKEENLTTPENSQFDVHSQVASVSVSETWGDSSSSDGSDTWMHPKISQQLPLAVKDLYAYFREWQKNAAHQARGSEQETNQSGASPLTNTTSSCSQINGGRTNKDSNKRRSSDEDENRASKNARLDSSSDRDDTRLLACPFAKKNPLQHRKCFKYVLQEIARLK